MRQAYSTYEAKTRFSEVMRKVRSGHRIIITFHGREVAEIRRLEQGEETTEGRVRRLRERGVLVPAGGKRGPWKAVANRPGALERFLRERE